MKKAALERRVSTSARESHGFELGRAFSSGRQGVVYHAEHIKSQKEAVVKLCYFSKDSKRERFEEEVRNTLLVQGSRHTVRVIHHHQEDSYGVMYLKRYETDLLEYLLDHPFDLAGAKAVFHRVCKAVEFAHSKRLAHRDIKPENIFVDTKGRPFLGDFGSSVVMDADDALCRDCVGTELYCAPEVLREEEYDPFKADVFSLGITLHVLACGHWPYAGSTKRQVRENIMEGKVKLMSSAFDTPGLKLIKRLTAFDPADRPSMAEVVADPWFTASLPLVGVRILDSLDDPSTSSICLGDSSDEEEDCFEEKVQVGDFTRYGSVADPSSRLLGPSDASPPLRLDRGRTAPKKRSRSLSMALQRLNLRSSLQKIVGAAKSKNRSSGSIKSQNSSSVDSLGGVCEDDVVVKEDVTEEEEDCFEMSL